MNQYVRTLVRIRFAVICYNVTANVIISTIHESAALTATVPLRMANLTRSRVPTVSNAIM